MLLLVVALPAAQPAAPPPTGLIVGRVVDAATGRPIAGAIVTITGGALQRGERLTGHIEFEGSLDRPDASALMRMFVSAEPADGPPVAIGGAPPGHPDEMGVFKTYGLEAGRYFIRAAPWPPGWTLKSVVSEGRDVSELPFELKTSDVNNIVITFTDHPTKLTGVAHTKDGNPDSDALVVVFPSDPSAWSNLGANSRRLRSARTLVNGTYTLTGLPAGDYYIAAISDDSIPQWQDPQVLAELARTATQVRLAEGDTRSQDLVRSGSEQ